MKTLRYKCVDCGELMATGRKRCPKCHEAHKIHEVFKIPKHLVEFRKLNICERCSKPFEGNKHQKLCPDCRHKSHQSNLKVDNNKVIATINRNPCATLQQVGDKYGISRERVSQIVREHKLKRVDNRIRKTQHICLNCAQIITGAGTKFCNRKCQYEYSHPLVSCSNCAKLFRTSVSHMIYSMNHNQGNGKIKQRLFCSKKCKGEYAGKHYGFAVHHERKYDYSNISDLLKSGLNRHQISKRLNIPYPTIFKIAKTLKKEELACPSLSTANT